MQNLRNMDLYVVMQANANGAPFGKMISSQFSVSPPNRSADRDGIIGESEPVSQCNI